MKIYNKKSELSKQVGDYQALFFKKGNIACCLQVLKHADITISLKIINSQH